MTTTTCWRTAMSSVASSYSTRSGRRAAAGCGRAGTMARSSARRTAMLPPARLRWRPSRRAGGGSSEPLLPRPALMRRGDVVPRLIERVAYSDALPWPAFAGGEAQRVAVAAHQHGDGEIAALGGADDADDLLLGGGELHGGV